MGWKEADRVIYCARAGVQNAATFWRVYKRQLNKTKPMFATPNASSFFHRRRMISSQSSHQRYSPICHHDGALLTVR